MCICNNLIQSRQRERERVNVQFAVARLNFSRYFDTRFFSKPRFIMLIKIFNKHNFRFDNEETKFVVKTYETLRYNSFKYRSLTLSILKNGSFELSCLRNKSIQVVKEIKENEETQQSGLDNYPQENNQYYEQKRAYKVASKNFQTLRIVRRSQLEETRDELSVVACLRAYAEKERERTQKRNIQSLSFLKDSRERTNVIASLLHLFVARECVCV